MSEERSGLGSVGQGGKQARTTQLLLRELLVVRHGAGAPMARERLVVLRSWISDGTYVASPYPAQ